MIRFIETNELNVVSYLVTHDHIDHTKALNTLLKIYKAPVYAQRKVIDGVKTEPLGTEDEFRTGPFSIKAIRISGHSDDQVVYKIGNALFTGDTLLAGRISHTATIKERLILVKQIKSRLLCLDDDTVIYPGHGAVSKIGIEKLFNPYLKD